MCGTTGTGKSTAIKALLAGQKRALIFPANNFDPAWHEYEVIKPKKGWALDPRDHHKKRRIAVYRIPDLHTFKGVRVVDTAAITDDREKVSLRDSIIHVNGFIDGCLVFDDFKNWIPSKGSLPGIVRSMLGDIRHKRTDIILATHALNEINAEFVTFIHNIYLFKTTLPPNDTFAKKMGARYEDLLNTFNRVNEKAKANKHYVEEFKLR